MAFDAHTNLAQTSVATAPSPATSGTSLVVTGSTGSRFPAVPFNATIGPANTALTSANSEIVRVTARSTDTLTITRAQEGTTARTVVVGDVIFAGPTVKTFTDIETQLATATADIAGAFPNGYGAWSTYTPSLTQSVTVTKTVEYARYTQVGKLISVQVSVSATSTGTAGQPIVIGLPADPSGFRAIGSCYVFDSSAGTFFAGILIRQGTSLASIVIGNGAGVTNIAGGTGGGFTAALASGDIVTFMATYETA
jgi:hypothetical protein